VGGGGQLHLLTPTGWKEGGEDGGQKDEDDRPADVHAMIEGEELTISPPSPLPLFSAFSVAVEEGGGGGVI
jgi:hypothetical protein